MGIQKEVRSWMAEDGSHERARRQGPVVAAGRAVLGVSCFPGRTELVQAAKPLIMVNGMSSCAR